MGSFFMRQFDQNLTQFCKFIAHYMHSKLKRTDWIQNHTCAWNCCVFSWNGSYMDVQYIHLFVLIQLLLPCFIKTHQWTIWVWKVHQGWSSAFMCVSLSRYEVTIVQKFGPLDYWAFGFKRFQWSKNKNIFENCLLAFIISAFLTNALLWRSATTSVTYPPTERNGGHEMGQMLINFCLYNFRSHHPLWDIFTKLLQNQKLHFELNNFSNEHLCFLWKPKR